MFLINIVAVFLLILAACNEDPHYQFPVDEIAPGVVTDVQVENFKGYSQISYVTPKDQDLLYIECQFRNSRNEVRITRSSAFTNKLQVTGFLYSNQQAVTLYSVDKSGNYSKGVTIDIEPLDSPAFDILHSIEIVPAFGGAKVSWVNQTEMEVVLEILLKNKENGQFEAYENFYSSAPELTKAVRGLESIEQELGIVIRDQYQQRTDTISAVFTPFFEQELDYSNFTQLPKHPDFDFNAYSDGWGSLWNKKYGKESYSIFGAGLGSVWFSFDLGNQVKLSRFKMWVRHDFYYAHSHPKHIEIWGTNDPIIANTATSFDGWQKISEWNDQKPSGLSSSFKPTADDLAHIKAGVDLEMPLEAPSVRYIRWNTVETWGGTDRMWLSELEIWGQINEE